MDQNELLECISFFNELRVNTTDVTNDDEIIKGYKVVIAEYCYQGKTYKTKKLFYRDISKQQNIYNSKEVESYFGEKVFWLDNQTHDWPHGRGAEIEDRVIKNMIEGDQPEFETLLKQIANNSKSGYLQKITKEGRSQQYGFNFENNNHWHDLVKLIQAAIDNKGNCLPQKYFKHLVFNWKAGENRERVSLRPKFAIIIKLLYNIKNIQSQLHKMDIIQLLKHQKQIILQGPPGTGKTYTAKDIAEKMIFGEVTEDKKEQKKRLENTEQFKLVQFHPSYSYEDFVRGITAKNNENGQIEYVTEDKTFIKFIKNEFNNIKINDIILYQWVDKFWDELDQNGPFFIDQNNFCFEMRKKNDDNSTLYFSLKRDETEREHFINKNIMYRYASFKLGYSEVKDDPFPSNHYRKKRVADDFINYFNKNYIPPKVLIIDEINRANLSSVLGELIYGLEYRGEKVESMYAIKRDTVKEKDNTKDGNNAKDDYSIVIPQNLYIIGTMNTADRSVGHIDYAIRRRFAFESILPNISVIKNPKAKELFSLVAALFVSDKEGQKKNSAYLAPDFDYKDVQLGHSYFILKDGSEKEQSTELKMRLKYEILPILNEYVKDGLLLESANEQIEKIASFEC